jgi:hypothetical protein
MNPLIDVGALEERNVWYIEFLIFVRSNPNTIFRYCKGESGDKFRSDVTLPIRRFD